MFSMSMTSGPDGRVRAESIGVLEFWRNGTMEDYYSITPLPHYSLSLRRFLIVGNLRAFLQLPADRAVTSRNHFVARLDALFYLHVSVVRNSGRHFDQLRLASFFQTYHLRQFFAFPFLGRFFLALVHELGAVVAFIALRDFLFFLFDLLRAQIAVAGPDRHRLHRHRHHVFHHVGLDICRATKPWSQ